MADDPERDQVLQRADEIFLARSLISDEARTEASGPVFGVAELVRFLADPDATLTAVQSRALFSDRKLADSFRALRRRASAFDMPAMAAASDGELSERTFPGGVIRIRPARIRGQFYVSITLTGEGGGAVPRQLLLVREATGETSRIAIADPGDGAVLLVVVDPATAAGAQALAMLRDPLVEGTFLK